MKRHLAVGGPALALVCLALSACAHAHRDPGVIVFTGQLAGHRGDAGYYAEAPDGTHRRKLPFAVTDYDLGFSANGRFAAWWDTKPLNRAPIVVARSDGTHRRVVPLAAAAGAVSPSLSPDGKRVALVYSPNAAGPNRAWNVWIVATDGRGLKSLTSVGSVITAAWSPDGARVALVVQASEVDRTVNTGEIYVVGSDGSGLHRVARGRDPAWSPDGRKLAYTDPKYRLDVVDANGGRIRIVSSHALGPAWSPDGKHLAFTRAVPCGGEGCPQTIVIVDVRTHAEHTIGPTFGGSSRVLWTTAIA
jgi:Tol biopolymer transport system component